MALGNIMPIIITAHMIAVSRNGLGVEDIAMPGIASMPDICCDRRSRYAQASPAMVTRLAKTISRSREIAMAADQAALR